MQKKAAADVRIPRKPVQARGGNRVFVQSQKIPQLFQAGCDGAGGSSCHNSAHTLEILDMHGRPMRSLQHEHWGILKKPSTSSSQRGGKKCERAVTWDEPVAKLYTFEVSRSPGWEADHEPPCRKKTSVWGIFLGIFCALPRSLM